MYKKLALFTILFVIFSISSVYAGTIEDRITFGDKMSHKLSLYESKNFSDSTFGWSAYFNTKQSWSSGYAGPTWSPKKWIIFSASVGIQTTKSGENPLYYAGSALLINSIGSIYTVAEKGDKSEDYWWKVKPMLNIGHGVKAGIVFEKDKNVAPILEVSITKTGISVWGTYYKDAPQLGLKYNF